MPAIWHNRNTVMPRRRAADGSPHIGSTHTQLIVISSAYGHGTGTRLRQADPFGRVRALPASAGTGRCPGFVTVTTGVRTVSRDWSGSRRCDILPLRGGFGPEVSQRGSGDEMALNIEVIVDSGMDAKKALDGSC